MEKQRSKGRSKNRRRAKRLRDAEQAGNTGRVVKKAALKHIAHAEPVAATLHVNATGTLKSGAPTSLADVPKASTAFVGCRPPTRTKQESSQIDNIPLSKEEMLERQFTYVKWDGVLVHPLSSAVEGGDPLTALVRTTVPLLDSADRVFAVLVGRPKSEDWPEVERDICAALDRARQGLSGSQAAPDRAPPLHRRGDFLPLASGISYGGGQKVCILGNG